MTIRDEQPEDMPGIRKVVEAAFPKPLEAKLVDQLRADGDSVISLVAVEGERVVGYILFSRMSAPFRALSLGPVAVLPDKQGVGVGSKLIREGLKRAASDGWEAVFVLGDPAYISGSALIRRRRKASVRLMPVLTSWSCPSIARFRCAKARLHTRQPLRHWIRAEIYRTGKKELHEQVHQSEDVGGLLRRDRRHQAREPGASIEPAISCLSDSTWQLSTTLEHRSGESKALRSRKAISSAKRRFADAGLRELHNLAMVSAQ